MISFNLPNHIILERDARKGLKQLQAANTQEGGVDDLPEPARSIAVQNKGLVDESGLAGLADKFDKLIQETPVFDVILATYPHDTFLKEVSNWFRREIHQNTLFNIQVRRSIAGGIVVRSKNRIFDMSLRPKIIEGRDKISEVLHSV